MVSGVISLTATASDNVGVSGVQFLVDGNAIGTEDTTAPYSVSWNTISAVNGTHQVTARARDTGGNLTTSPNTAVTVNNTIISGLVAAYSFNEQSGTTVLDSSGNQNNGSISGATRVAGKYGNGLSFNGTSALVTITNSASFNLTTGMTVEAWVNSASNTGWRCVITKETTGDNIWAIYGSGGSATPGFWGVVNGSTYSATGTVLTLNTWTHLAATFDGTTIQFYKNGALAGSRAAPGALPITPNSLFIGGNSVFGEYFSGVIDEVRIYNRALAAAEIQTDMNTAIVP
jgi:hypothetical protein